jgi:hypothetical protein
MSSSWVFWWVSVLAKFIWLYVHSKNLYHCLMLVTELQIQVENGFIWCSLFLSTTVYMFSLGSSDLWPHIGSLGTAQAMPPPTAVLVIVVADTCFTVMFPSNWYLSAISVIPCLLKLLDCSHTVHCFLLKAVYPQLPLGHDCEWCQNTVLVCQGEVIVGGVLSFWISTGFTPCWSHAPIT